jgi:precorrin-6B methylase 2
MMPAMPLAARLRSKLGAARQAALRLWYERGSSVDTSDVVHLDELGLDHPERHRYAPAGWRALRLALDGIEVQPGDVFVDIGSGVGRVVVQAARLPFAKVIGVELSEDLTVRAQTYVDEQREKLRAPVELLATDAMAWQLPNEVTHVFLNNPFTGSILQAVVDNVVASLERAPRPLVVIYLNPTEPERLLETGRFTVVKEVRRGKPGNADDILVLRASAAAA